MSDVKRRYTRIWSLHSSPAYGGLGNVEVVNATDYDALAQQLAASQARCEEILEDFEIIKDERESAGRQASAFEDRMGEYQSRCGKLEDRLTEAHATITRLEAANTEISDMLVKKGAQLAASQARESVLEDTIDKLSMAFDSRVKTIGQLLSELAARDKRLAEAEVLLRDVQPMMAKTYANPWFTKRAAFLSPAEDKANEEKKNW